MTPDIEQHLAVLAKEAGFSLEELEANRRGKLHATQVKRGRPGSGGFLFWLFMTLLFAGGGGGGAFAFYDSLRKPVERVDMNGVYAIALGGALLTLGSLVLAIKTLASALRSRAVYDRGECVTWDITFDFTQRDQTFADYFYVRRGNEQLSIPKGLARLMRPGARYRVYIGDGSLISLEPLA